MDSMGDDSHTNLHVGVKVDAVESCHEILALLLLNLLNLIHIDLARVEAFTITFVQIVVIVDVDVDVVLVGVECKTPDLWKEVLLVLLLLDCVCLFPSSGSGFGFSN